MAVFISHHAEDALAAEQLAGKLRARGLAVWWTEEGEVPVVSLYVVLAGWRYGADAASFGEFSDVVAFGRPTVWVRLDGCRSGHR